MKLRHALTTFTIGAFAAIFLTGTACADSCPYCGQQYGDAAPGDEARVYSLRQQHEATCPSRPGGAAYGQAAAARRAEEERIRQEEEQLKIERETARRERSAKMKRDREELARQQEEFEAGKKDLLSSIKGGTPVPALKGASDMPVINPVDLKGPPKGLKIKKIPTPLEKAKEVAPLYTKSRANIILDAFEKNGGDLDKSIAFLAAEMKKYDFSTRIKEALSYLEGMRAGAAFEKRTGSQLKPDQASASAIFASYATPWGANLPSMDEKKSGAWHGPAREAPFWPPSVSMAWKAKRTNMFLEALEKGNKGLDKSIAYLEKQKKGPRGEEAEYALQYLHGFFSYKEYVDKQQK